MCLTCIITGFKNLDMFYFCDLVKWHSVVASMYTVSLSNNMPALHSHAAFFIILKVDEYVQVIFFNVCIF